MKDQKIIRAAMAAQIGTSRVKLNRVLDPEASNVTLETLSRAARVLGCSLKVDLAGYATRESVMRALTP